MPHDMRLCNTVQLKTYINIAVALRATLCNTGAHETRRQITHSGRLRCHDMVAKGGGKASHDDFRNRPADFA